MRHDEVKKIIDDLESLKEHQESFLTRLKNEPEDLESNKYYSLGILEGYDVIGNEIIQTVFRHQESSMVRDYATLFLGGKRVRVTKIKRELPGTLTGVVEEDRYISVPYWSENTKRLNGGK